MLPCLGCPLSSSFIFFASSRYSFSLIMSSFLFDTAIGMSGIDSGALVELPMMDWEVISIGSSLSQDTHRGASDSESSSPERVRVLCRIGGGTSRPRGIVRPSTTSREPILVIVILPPSTFGGVKRGCGNGDVRASSCIRCSHRLGCHCLYLLWLVMSRCGMMF